MDEEQMKSLGLKAKFLELQNDVANMSFASCRKSTIFERRHESLLRNRCSPLTNKK